MSYTIANLKDDLTPVLHGTSLRKLSNPTDLINRAARDVLQDTDPAETKREQQITNAVYSDVYSYQLPSDLKGNKIIDIFPQVNRDVGDSARQSYAQSFEKNKKDDTFYVEYKNGNKSLKYSKAVRSGITISEMDVITNWTVGADTTNLAKDTLQYLSGGASLKFDLSGATTEATLENASLTSQDLSDEENEGSFFLWCYFPDSSIITNVKLRWGNSATLFWEATATAKHDGTAFSDGWNIVRFDWNGASKTGSPDSSDIDYVKITITYDGTADTNLRVDSLIYRLGDIFKIAYYSKYLFTNSSGVFIENSTDDTDTINLDTDSYNVLLYKLAELAAQELQGQDGSFDITYYKQEYNIRKTNYNRTYKSEAIKPQQKYYRI